MIEPDHPDLSIGQQCKLLSIARSSYYYEPKGETEQIRRHNSTNCAQVLRIAAPLSRRKSAMVLRSGARRPISHISSTLRPASRSRRRLDGMRFR